MKKKGWIDWLAYILVIVGGINWGLYAFDWNLVNLIFGAVAWLESLVYVLVGLSAIYMIFKKK